MGKAVILSSKGAGLYRVKLQFDNSRVGVRKTAITQRLTVLSETLADLEPELNSKISLLGVALQQLNEYIDSTDPAIYTSEPSTMNQLIRQSFSIRAEVDTLRSQNKKLTLEKKSLESEQDYYQKYCPDELETDAWCVSYNENLTGDTKTVEVDYCMRRGVSSGQIAGDTGVWIPATQSQSTPTAPDSVVVHALAGSAHSAWFNLAMVPAMQRIMGRYRIATLSSVDKSAHTCSLTFDGQYSVADNPSQLLDHRPIYPEVAGEQRQALSDVAIVYPPCNARVFESGDKVVVDLHSGSAAPTVIGFYSYPKRCKAYDWTGALGFADGIPVDNGVKPHAGQIGPVATGQDVLSVLIELQPFIDSYTDGDVVRQTSSELSVAGSYPLSWTHTILDDVVLAYSQTITVSCSASMAAAFTYGVARPYSATGSGTVTTTVTTNLSINGAPYGQIHSITITSSTATTPNATGDLAVSTTEHRTFNVTSKSLAIYDDGTLKATALYAASGACDYKDSALQSGSYIVSRTMSGDLSDIVDNSDQSGSFSGWPTASIKAYVYPKASEPPMWPGGPWVYTTDYSIMV